MLERGSTPSQELRKLVWVYNWIERRDENGCLCQDMRQLSEILWADWFKRGAVLATPWSLPVIFEVFVLQGNTSLKRWWLLLLVFSLGFFVCFNKSKWRQHLGWKKCWRRYFCTKNCTEWCCIRQSFLEKACGGGWSTEINIMVLSCILLEDSRYLTP